MMQYDAGGPGSDESGEDSWHFVAQCCQVVPNSAKWRSLPRNRRRCEASDLSLQENPEAKPTHLRITE